jgi:non-ribosomal peptide synthase protein (TIGR01720 family)
VCFNYLGRLDAMFPPDALFTLAPEPTGPHLSPRGARHHLIALSCAIFGNRLETTWSFSAIIHRRETIERVATAFLEVVRELTAAARSSAVEPTERDFPDAGLSQAELAALVRELDDARESIDGPG